MFSSEETDDDDTETECEAINVGQERTIGPEDYTDFQVNIYLWIYQCKPRTYYWTWGLYWFPGNQFSLTANGTERRQLVPQKGSPVHWFPLIHPGNDFLKTWG